MKDNFLQDIWQIHTDVQEQMLRLRSAPVSIIPESARIVGEKLFLTADENDKTEKIIEEIAAIFKIPSSEINIEKGYLFADIVVAQSVENLILPFLRQLTYKVKLDFFSGQLAGKEI